MQRKLIAMAVMALPVMAHAGSDSSTALLQKLEALEQQVKALQQSNAQIPLLQQQVQNLQQQLGSSNTAASTGNAPTASESEEPETLQQTVNSLKIKVDTLSEAAQTGPIAGLSVSGFVDPMFLYNRNSNSAGFRFLNKNSAYNYYDSNLGDVYLDIKKTFGVGPEAPSVELVIQPDRGSGASFSSEGGGLTNSIFNQANVNLPLSSTGTLQLGLLPSLAGYEPNPANLTQTLTHNLLFDFSEPASYLGMNYKLFTNNYQTLWQFMLANEQLKSAGSIVSQNGRSNSNSTPTLAARVDYQYTSSLDLGFSANIGRQTIYTPSSCTSGFGYQCNLTSPFGRYFYAEADLTYTWSDIQYNAQLDYGQQAHAAWNGGMAQWYGFSLLAAKKWNTDWLGKVGTVVRVDYLNNSRNGGGGSGILYGLSGNTASINPTSGWGVDQQCLNASSNNGIDCKGTNRSDIALDLLFYPADKMTVKLEYRHDFASNAVFQRSDGSLSRNNDILATQFIYAF
ncbi:DUF3138 family protein [Aquitalea pelogenes]|uniref:DUF3138 family protein n=1 Tax=Aquitalea pelogenes TaxID=1293573 RepID=UPI0035B20E17